jgi:hypothetical protein
MVRMSLEGPPGAVEPAVADGRSAADGRSQLNGKPFDSRGKLSQGETLQRYREMLRSNLRTP